MDNHCCAIRTLVKDMAAGWCLFYVGGVKCRGCETAPETVAEDFPFFDNKGGTPLVLLEASLPTEQDNGDWRLGSGAPVLAKQKYGSWEQTSS